MNRISLVFVFAMCPALLFGEPTADRVIVDKSEGTMILYADEFMLGFYFVSFGANPEGHKQEEGDERTPEGRYTLDFKKAGRQFTRLRNPMTIISGVVCGARADYGYAVMG